MVGKGDASCLGQPAGTEVDCAEKNYGELNLTDLSDWLDVSKVKEGVTVNLDFQIDWIWDQLKDMSLAGL